MNPKVSICIPAYKQAALLRKVLGSVRMQTYGDYELIITDDSPDNAVEALLNEFDFKGRLKYFKNPVALGSPANWNYAISLAGGEYIKVLHTDDFFTSMESLEKYVALLDTNSTADFGYSASEVLILSDGKKSVYSSSAKQLKRLENEVDFLFFRNVIGAPSSTIYRKGVNLKYDTNLKWLVDVDFYMRILKKNRVIAYCNEALVCTIDGAEGQITQTVSKDSQLQIREHVLLFNKMMESNMVSNKNKFSLFFKLLFNKHNIKSIAELNKIIFIPIMEQPFYAKVISSVNKGMFLTRLRVKFYNSGLNKKFLKMEMF